MKLRQWNHPLPLPFKKGRAINAVKETAPPYSWGGDLRVGNLMITSPLYVYINWSAYDELSDDKELDESLAMRQMAHFLRLRKAGVRLDCYMMDAVLVREKQRIPAMAQTLVAKRAGPLLKACKSNNITPGLWFSVIASISRGLAPVAPGKRR